MPDTFPPRTGTQPQSAPPAAGAADTQRQTDASAGGADLLPPAASSLQPLGRFAPLHFHARGGLGEVYRARDDELNREVALKRLRDDRADLPDCRRRFLLEAEVTARLEHPGVVPVHGLVRDAAGRPCYAMRFVQGETLADASDGFHRTHADRWPSVGPGQVAFRQLLQRFVSLCQTVAYAHARGVIHRDLKPANVLLGKYGETLLLDWGLAKPIGRADPADESTLQPGSPGSRDGETQPGSALGTPAYMSPEQAVGRWDVVGPASDVYGLGATLYCLLTGRSPVRGDGWSEVQQKIQRGDYPPPREVRPGVPPALEAVCRKAMALEPAARYSTALELADDVERWLADEPVGVWREPLAVRARRWVKRHRVLVSGLAAALVVGLVSLAVAAGLLREKNRDLEAANTAERRAKDDAVTARGEAEERFGMAKEAVDKYLAAVTEDPELKNANFHGLRKRLLESAVPFYERLARQKAGDAVQQFERGLAYWRLASVRSDLGEKAAAVAGFEQALAVFGRLAEEHPGDPRFRAAVAGAHISRGVMLRDSGNLRDAGLDFGEGVGMWRKLAAEFPAHSQYRADLAFSLNNLGVERLELGDPQAARRAYEEALEGRRKLAEAVPSELNRRALAASQDNMGNLLAHLGDRTEARKAYEQAVEGRRRLAEEFPGMPQYRNDHAASRSNLGNVLNELGDREGARRAQEAAVAIMRKLADEFPGLPQYRGDLAKCQCNLGSVLRDLGDREGARRTYEAAAAAQRKLAEQFPDVPEYRAELARSRSELGSLLGDRDEARRAHEEALGIQRKLADKFTGVPSYRFELASSHYKLGLLLTELGDPRAARQEHGRAIEIWRKLVEEFPADPQYRARLSASLTHLGLLLPDLREPQEARRAHEEAAEIRRKLVEEFPAAAEYRTQLAGSFCNLGNLILDAGQPAASLPQYDRAVELLRGVLKAGEYATARQFLRNTLLGRSDALTRLNRHADAVPDWEQLVETAPPRERPGLRGQLARALAYSGNLQRAVAEAGALARTEGTPPEMLYDCATVHALVCKASRPGGWVAGVVIEGHALRAVALLRQAQRGGLFRHPGVAAQLRKDPDFSALSQREDFRRLLAELDGAPGAKSPGGDR
jgi:serine/threonine-protein kinase